MKLNNKGFSLVELLIALAIASVILGAATVFLYNAQKSYQVAEETIDLQKESQVLMEQIGSWVMKSNHIEECTSVDGVILYSIPRNHGRTEAFFSDEAYGSSTKASKMVIWQSGNKLYMVSKDNIADVSVDTEINYEDEAIDENLVGEYIDLFSVDLKNVVRENGNKMQHVEITLGMKEGSRDYTLVNDFMMRNEHKGRD